MWNKFKQELFEGFVTLAIACAVLYFFAWIFNEPASALVGWMALGMAASALGRK